MWTSSSSLNPLCTSANEEQSDTYVYTAPLTFLRECSTVTTQLMPINSSSQISSFLFTASITSFCRFCRISLCFACSNCRSSSWEKFFTLTSTSHLSVGSQRTVPVDSQSAFVVMRCSSRDSHVVRLASDPNGVFSTVCDKTVPPLGRARALDEFVCTSNPSGSSSVLSSSGRASAGKSSYCPLRSYHPNLRGSTAMSVLVHVRQLSCPVT